MSLTHHYSSLFSVNLRDPKKNFFDKKYEKAVLANKFRPDFLGIILQLT